MSLSLSPSFCQSSSSPTCTSPRKRSPSKQPAIIAFPRTVGVESRRPNPGFILSPSPPLPNTIASPAKATRPKRPVKEACRQPAWTKSRPSRDKLDSSGSDDHTDEAESDLHDLSPAAGISTNTTKTPAAATPETIAASTAFANITSDRFPQVLHDDEDDDESRNTMPSSSSCAPQQPAHGLERHFATHVSMTPPASFGSHTTVESPFMTVSYPHQPATEARAHTSGIPRSHAFGSLSRFHTSRGPQGQLDRAQSHCGLRRKFANDGLRTDTGRGSTSAAGAAVQGLGLGLEDEAVTDSPRAHSRFKSESGLAARRDQAPSFLTAPTICAENDMDLDSDVDAPPPPSPSPMGDLTFPSRLGASPGGDEDAASSSFLRPGATHGFRKYSGRSVSNNEPTGARSASALPESFPTRSTTTPALRLTSALERESAPTPSSSTAPNLATMSSPYKTPKRRPTPGERSRALSSAAATTPAKEFAGPRSYSASGLEAPNERLAGSATLFGFASAPRPGVRASEGGQATSREAKRRSTGSMAMTVGRSLTREALSARAAALQGEGNSPIGGFAASLAARSKRASIPPALRPATSTPPRSVAADVSSELDSPDRFFGDHDDSGVAFDDDGDTEPFSKGERLLGNHLGLHRSNNPMLHSIGSQSGSSPSPFQRSKVTPTGRIRAHAYPRERSSLANETKLASSSDAGSVASSPDVSRSNSRNFLESNPTESPVRQSAAQAAPSGDGQSYLTPQNYKNVRPLQAAFMSTGLVSKRNRPRPDAGTSTNGTENLPVPPKPNFGSALGLREVVAAANAHAAATAAAQGGIAAHAMPDTPVKKPTPLISAFQHALPGSSQRLPPGSAVKPAPGRATHTPSPLGAPAQLHDSTLNGGESPLLLDSCDSPTLNLISVGSAKKNQDWPGFSTLPRSRPSPELVAALPRSASSGHLEGSSSPGLSPMSPSVMTASTRPRSGSNSRKAKSRTSVQSSDSGRKALAPSKGSNVSARETKRTVPLQPSAGPIGIKLLHRKGRTAGLERKNSFPSPAEQGEFNVAGQSGQVIGSPAPGQDAVPMTPTRSGAQIKWFEAAQLVTTPSPSSRRQAAQQYRAQQQTILQRAPAPAPMAPRVGRIRHELMHRASNPMLDQAVHEAAPKAAESVSRFETQFTMLDTLGKGEFSEAVKVQDRASGCIYAVKRMKSAFIGPRDRLRRLEEVDILRHLSAGGKGHPNVISLVDAWEEDGHLFVQTELCPLGTLAFFLEHYGAHVEHLDEPRIWKILAELSAGLRHIHDHGVLHLDLKPANVFVTEIGTLKIGDFGMATRWPPADAKAILSGAGIEATDATSAPTGGDMKGIRAGGRRSSLAVNLEREGDREYLAPEIMLEGKYGKAADIFSLGLIILEIAGNVVLPDNGEPWQKLRNDDLSDVDLSDMSESLLRLIKSMLSSAPHLRPTIEDVVEHPVVKAVSDRMARGLESHELDQLPELDMPTHEFKQGQQLLQQQQQLPSSRVQDGDFEMQSGDDDRSAFSALGLTGISWPQEQAPHILVRGALVNEPESFLGQVLAADRFVPSVNAGEAEADDLSSSSGSYVSPCPMMRKLVDVRGEEDVLRSHFELAQEEGFERGLELEHAGAGLGIGIAIDGIGNHHQRCNVGDANAMDIDVDEQLWNDPPATA